MPDDPSVPCREETRSPGHGEPLPADEGVRTALKLWIVLARAQAAIAAHDQRNLDRCGLTRAEFGVLDALFFKGPLLLGEIQRKLLVSSGGTTYLIDRLAERGYVDRRRSPDDRRAVYAVLTPEGDAFFRGIFPEHAQGLVESVSTLSRDEQLELTRLLRKLGRGAAAQQRPEAGT